jgi:FAD/FMN-containing dehydrogenase
MKFESWGRYPTVVHRAEYTPLSRCYTSLRGAIEREFLGGTLLPVGLGRSYGDVCLNHDSSLLRMHNLTRFISFSRSDGVVRCEAGMSLSDLLAFAVPRGWFLPVSPGTKFVTVGGAIANDVHGKNHHLCGTFGRYVNRFEILRSDGSVLDCSADKNTDIFRATIGGLGLTGTILWAEIQLKPITSPFIAIDSIKFSSLDEFFTISAETSQKYEYTVSWIDCISRGSEGRGIFMGGNHTSEIGKRPLPVTVTLPFQFPEICLNHYSMRLFNEVYYHRQRAKSVHKIVHYNPFFYPLDAVSHWNRAYGPRGFLQFQCVISRESFPELFTEVLRSGSGSFLAVLKEFGDSISPGIMSFPRQGVTLALDFPFRGDETLHLLRRLEHLVRAAGGRLYPAKDAVMEPESFTSFYPQSTDFAKHIDPRHSSSFWRRVNRC